MTWTSKTSGTSAWMRGVWGITVLPPTLIREPVSPTPGITSRLMQWSTASDDADADIESLTLEGTSAVVNNVVQSGFTGTCAANADGGYDVDVLATVDQWQKLPALDWSIRFNNGVTVTKTGIISKIRAANLGTGWYINSDGDNETTNDGRLKRDNTILTRALIRLKVRRGQWTLDPNFGCRVWTIETTKNAGRLAETYIREALQPMIDDGSIDTITVGNVKVREPDGGLYVEIGILPVGAANTVSLGRLSLGGGN